MAVASFSSLEPLFIVYIFPTAFDLALLPPIFFFPLLAVSTMYGYPFCLRPFFFCRSFFMRVPPYGCDHGYLVWVLSVAPFPAFSLLVFFSRSSMRAFPRHFTGRLMNFFCLPRPLAGIPTWSGCFFSRASPPPPAIRLEFASFTPCGHPTTAAAPFWPLIRRFPCYVYYCSAFPTHQSPLSR